MKLAGVRRGAEAKPSLPGLGSLFSQSLVLLMFVVPPPVCGVYIAVNDAKVEPFFFTVYSTVKQP